MGGSDPPFQRQQEVQAERERKQAELVSAHKRQERELVKQGKKPFYLKTGTGAVELGTGVGREKGVWVGTGWEGHEGGCA